MVMEANNIFFPPDKRVGRGIKIAPVESLGVSGGNVGSSEVR